MSMKSYWKWTLSTWIAISQLSLTVLAESDAGDEFSNNLFSDLAPLLTLFGERVATQYLRHSTHPLESVIFACGPLGVLTAITSAIRVGGSRALKAIIGRAEEIDTIAEIELLSSTSTDVCELWNSLGVVRAMGKPQILELVIDDFNEVVRESTNSSAPRYGLYTRKQWMCPAEPPAHLSDGELKQINNAPNISLNTIGSDINMWELYIVAIIGVLLQTGVLVFDGLQLVIGIFLCAHIIEGSTMELEWIPNHKKRRGGRPPRVIWVQRNQTVGDQTFQSFAIYSPVGARRKHHLMTSHRLPQTASRHRLTLLATSLSVIGFILQFVGYSVEELHDGFELDDIAMKHHKCDTWQVVTYPTFASEQEYGEYLADPDRSQERAPAGLAEKVLDCHAQAMILSETIVNIMNLVWISAEAGKLVTLVDDADVGEFWWSIPVQARSRSLDQQNIAAPLPSVEFTKLSAKREKVDGKWTPWQIDPSRIEALLQLWMLHLKKEHVTDGKTLWLLCPPDQKFEILLADCWIGRGSTIVSGKTIVQICRDHAILSTDDKLGDEDIDSPRPILDYHRIIGYVGLPPERQSSNSEPPIANLNSDLAGATISRAIIKPMSLLSMGTQCILYQFFYRLAANYIEGITSDTHIIESQNSLPLLTNNTIRDLAHTAQSHGALTVDDAYRLIVCSLNAAKKLPRLDAEWMHRTLRALTVDPTKPDFAKLNQHISLISHIHPLSQSPVEGLGQDKHPDWSSVTNIVLRVIELCDGHLRGNVDDTQVQQHISHTGELILDFKALFHVSRHVENTSDNTNGDKESSGVSSLCATNLMDIPITDAYSLLQDPAININERNESGATALENAAYHGRIGVVMLLLLHGAKLGDQGARKPLYWALEGGNRSNGTVEITCLEIIRMSINQGAPVCSKQDDEGDDLDDGLSLLDTAIGLGFHQVAEILLQHFALRIYSPEHPAWQAHLTALNLAVSHGHKLLVKFLIDRWTDIVTNHFEGNSPLHCTAFSGYPAVAELLLDRGDDISAKNRNGTCRGCRAAA
ncbi:hypothetical protein BDZ91DRAFT_784528 [Kalaharituber pfeilii]|nr:hypothetical protein BDZ91DRAFT_784528 [Kalaharituber pfeilii]